MGRLDGDRKGRFMTTGTLVISLRGLSSNDGQVIGTLYADGRVPLDRSQDIVSRICAHAQQGAAELRFEQVPPGHYAVVYEVAGSRPEDLNFAALHFDGADRAIALRSFAA